MVDFARFDLFFNSQGTQKTISDITGIDKALNLVDKSSKGAFATLARVLNTSVTEALRLQQALDLKPAKIAQAANLWKNLAKEGASNEQKFQALNKALGITERQFATLDTALQRFSMQSSKVAQSNSGMSEGLGMIAFKYNQIIQILGTVLSAAKPLYDFLIGSNEELNQQILSVQTNLASVAEIKVGSQVLSGAEAILASRERISQSIKQLEKDTVDLVGITTEETQRLYQITLQSAKQLVGQTKGLSGNVDLIRSAELLTKGWAAALGTIGVPLAQAREEINSILRGNITNNSQLAKTLGITNVMVSDWKKQGTLVKELTDRFQVYVEGNKEAAKSITGVSSNIKDIVQILGREAGKDLLDPLVKGLTEFYNLLKENQTRIIQFFNQMVTSGSKVVGLFGEAFKPIFAAIVTDTLKFATAMNNLLTFLGRVSEAGTQAFSALNSAIIPTIRSTASLTDGINRIVNAFNYLADQDAYKAIEQVVMQSERLYGETDNVVKKLQEYQKIQQENGKLTADQTKSQQQFSDMGVSLIDSYNRQIAALRAIQTTRQEDKTKIDQQIKVYELYKAAIQNAGGGLQLLEKEQITSRNNWENITTKINENIKTLSTLNTNTEDYQQLSEDTIKLIRQKQQFTGQATQEELAALQRLSNATGLDLDLRKSAKDTIIAIEKDKTNSIVESYKQQKIAATDAISQLSAIKNNADNEVSIRQDASEKIVEIIKDRQEKELQVYRTRESEINTLMNSGFISEMTAEKRLTENKIAEISKRIEQVRELRLQEQSPVKVQELLTQEKAYQEEITKLRLDSIRKENDSVKANYEQRLNTIKALYEAQSITEQTYSERRLEISNAMIDIEINQQRQNLNRLSKSEIDARQKIIDKITELEAEKRKNQIEYENTNLQIVIDANNKAEKAVEASLQKRLAFAKQAQLERLRAGQSVTDAEKQTEDQVRAITEQGLADQINLTKNAIAEISRLRMEGFGNTQQLAEQETALNQRLAELNLQAISNEIDAVKRLRDERILGIQQSYEATISNLEVQSNLLNSINEAYEIQNSLIDAQSSLQSALSSLTEQRYQTAIKIAKEAGNEALAAKLQNELYQKQIEGLREQFELKLQEERINRLIRENNAQQNMLQAEMNKLKADEALLTAQINKDNEQKVALLQKQVELAQKAVENAQVNVDAQKSISDTTEQRLRIEQTIAEERLKEDRRAFNAEQERQAIAEKARQAEAAANEERSKSNSNVVPNRVISGTVIQPTVIGGDTKSFDNLDKTTAANTRQLSQLTEAINSARSTPSSLAPNSSLVYYDKPGSSRAPSGVAGLYANQTNIINLNNVVDPYSTVTRSVNEMTQQIKLTESQ